MPPRIERVVMRAAYMYTHISLNYSSNIQKAVWVCESGGHLGQWSIERNVGTVHDGAHRLSGDCWPQVRVQVCECEAD